MEKLEKFIVLDTETANSLDDPLAYDVGFAVVDALGNVYETHSFAIAEIFLDTELMQSAYFAEKIPQYHEELRQGTRRMARFETVKRILAETVKRYNVKIIAAHNARFDYRSMNTTLRLLTGSASRYAFPYGIEIWDTLKMAREVLGKNDEYKTFCVDNGNCYGKNNTPRYTAEAIYQFLTKDAGFVEEHKGLADVLIEKDILAYCLQHQPEMDGRLWR